MSGWTLAFQIINFLVLAAVLQRFLFKPVTRIVAKRQQEIGALTAEAEKAKAAAEEARQRYERELAGTAAERERALALAREEAGKERERLVVQANQEAKALVDAGRATLERERRETRRRLSEQTLGLAVDVAARLLSEVTPGTGAAPFLERLCQHLERLPPESLAALNRELSHGAELVLAVEPTVPDQERPLWTSRLAKYFGTASAIKVVNDHALVAGAELRLPHTTLGCSWRDALERAKKDCLPNDDAL